MEFRNYIIYLAIKSKKPNTGTLFWKTMDFKKPIS